MAELPASNARTDVLVRSIRVTMANAVAIGPPYSLDAARYLEEFATAADELSTQLEDNDRDRETLTALQHRQNHRCNELLGDVHDRHFNAIHRVRKDTKHRKIFPGGTSRYRQPNAFDKPFSLELLARMLELHKHPKVSPEVRAEMVSALRREAAALAETNTKLAPLRIELSLLQAQSSENARAGRAALVNLKQYWKSQGETEAAIHRIIPPAEDRRAKDPKDKQAPETSSKSTDPPAQPSGDAGAARNDTSNAADTEAGASDGNLRNESDPPS